MKSEQEINVDDDLIAKYLSGESTPEEALVMDDWLQQPVNKTHFQEFESTWNRSSGEAVPVFNSKFAWSQIEESIGASTEKENQVRELGMSRWTLSIAASLLIVAVSVVLVVLNKKGEIKYSTVATANEPKVVQLADQSVVTVNHHTTLDYPIEFAKDSRQLNLKQGEAFFEIAPDKTKPFIIHTTAAEIRVVGTKFNVIATAERTEISVQSGKVLARSSQDSVLLVAGSTGVFYVNQQESFVKNDSLNNVWGYATHKLVFKDTPMKAAIRDIEKAYPVSISVVNKNINKCRLTATFDNDSVDKVVNLIAEILNLRVKQDGKNFTLEGEGCP